MRLSVATADGDVHTLDVPADMEIENLAALLEMECQVPVEQQEIFHNSNHLADMKKTLAQYCVVNDDIVLVKRRLASSGHGRAPRPSAEDPDGQIEALRQQILSNPIMLRQLKSHDPRMADLVGNDPTGFARAYKEQDRQRREREAQLAAEFQALHDADPFDVEAQKKIEEAIRRERIAENKESAYEHHPEAFVNVHMLYIPVEVNGVLIKAFVDSGAQRTTMSPSCAEKTGLMRLVDTTYSGIARGAGTAKIIGRVHMHAIKVGNLHLPCTFTVMEGKDVDLLFGLDMLKRHQACIDLENNCLRVHGEAVEFLPESEIPMAFHPEDELADDAAPGQALNSNSGS